MEFLKIKIKEFKQNENDFNEYKSKLKSIKEILKNNNVYEKVYESFDSLNNKTLYLYFVFFQNFENFISINIDNNLNQNDKNKVNLILKYLKKNCIIKEDYKKINIFNLFIHWFFYLYLQFTQYFYQGSNPIYSKINKIRYAYRETNNIILKLYKKSIFTTSQIFNLLKFDFCFIENKFEVKSDSDNLYKSKNYLLLQGLFFILTEASILIINKVNKANLDDKVNENIKTEIQELLSFLEFFQNNKEINSKLIKMVIANHNLMQMFMNKILNVIDIKIISKYEPKFINKLLCFFSHFFRFNYSKSKIYNLILSSLKQSFINLYNFDKNKNKIIHDLFVNSFYTKLLKKIICYDENENIYHNISHPLFNCFYFNGIDSILSINAQNLKNQKNQNMLFEKSTLFFSFYLTSFKDKKIYPLVLIQKYIDGRGDNLFYLYLKKCEENKQNSEEEYDICLSYNNKEKKIDNTQKIKSNTIYYFSICFNEAKLLINFCNKKEQIISYSLDKNKKLLDTVSPSFLFGSLPKNKEVFSGYFGPIIIVKNPKDSKDLNEFISSILKLESNYKNFMFYNKNYNSEIALYFQEKSNHEQYSKFENIECLLYLVPEIFCFFSKKISSPNHLPNVDNICKIQRTYNIYKLNITLVKHEKGLLSFIMDNGLNYICLLYEYIYQFSENYNREEMLNNNSFKKDKDIMSKFVISIFKKTLFIVEKSYHQIKVQNFNKCFKQIYMNLFFSIKSLCKNNFKENSIDINDDNISYKKENNNIINCLINYFFGIMKYYHNLLSNTLKKKFLPWANKIDFNNSNNNSLKTNFYCLNGWIEFLLSLDIYSPSDKNTLIKLFSELESYFDYLQINTNSENSNHHLFLKLLNFIKLLNYFYGDKDSNIINNKTENNDKNNVNENKINCFIEKNDVFDSYFKVLKSFYENNPSKSENINNLTTIFKFITDNFSENNHIFLRFSNFINELIGDNIDFFFIDKKEDEPIKKMIEYAEKISKNNIEKGILNKKELFNKLICILIRIIFSKQRIGKDDELKQQIKNLLENVEITNELVSSICNEVILLISEKKTSLNNIYILSNNKNQIIFSFDDLKSISNYYNEIFELIILFLENQNNDKNKNVNNEVIIIGSLEQILKYISSFFDNNLNVLNFDENNNSIFNVHLIYCLINFLKFYNTILFKKIYPKRYIDNFINLCEILYKSSLIYSNILINTSFGSTKTLVEIILDISIFYINLTSNKLLEKLSDLEYKNTLIEEQNIICKFIMKLFIKNYTIFYINDYFRFLSSKYPVDKKKPKNDPLYFELSSEFNKYQYIDKVLFNEKKFNFNFTTFFILKCNGYRKILQELFATESKEVMKFNEILTLIIKGINKMYIEHEMLYKKDRKFFFSKQNTSYRIYAEIKKEIEKNLNKNYNEIDTLILNKVFNKNFDDIYNKIYSGLCTIERLSINKHKHSDTDINDLRHYPHSQSSTNLKDFDNKNQKIPRTYSDDNKLKNKNLKMTPDDDDNFEFQLNIEETPPSEMCEEKISSNRKETFASTSSFNENFDSDKKSKNNRNLSESSIETAIINNINFVNYFKEPDEQYLKNPKKELMMTVFSIYFLDAFFNNEVFKIMKTYYLEKLSGVQKSTKLLDYPTKIKNYRNGLEPFLFLKPYSSFFLNKTFPITHEYFYNYMKKNNIQKFEPIILYKKIPEFNLEDKFERKCELIKINRGYFGHIIGSKNANYMIFEQQKFYKEYSEQNKNLNQNQKSSIDLNDLFSLTYINKKPFTKKRKYTSNSNSEEKNDEKNEKKVQYKKYKNDKIIIILFDEIEEILERRFLLMWQALEIYLKNGKSYFFNFLSKEQYEFILDIFKNNIITKNKIYYKDFLKNHPLITEWRKSRLSTYEYLLFLNKYSSRTFNDVNQYPVFPWVITKYKTDEKGKKIGYEKRNFKYPMAGQIEENRITAYNRFQDDEESGLKFPSHYGTHYSTSSYIFFYLMREEPFTTLLVKLQGNKQENPDRMFFSISDTLFVLEAGSDNRECIPDIFSKVEQFINLNCVDFGCKNSGLRVDDFIVSENKNSSVNNYYNNNNGIKNYVKFIIYNKKLFDEKEIRDNINDWFDIIFGVGQLPEKNMKKSLNIFRKETYEQKTDLHNKLLNLQKKLKNQEDIIKKMENKIDLIISFGQTPYQIFSEKHPKNGNIEEEDENFEWTLDNVFWTKNFLEYKTEMQPLFFELNISLGKIFLIDINRKLEIIKTNFFKSGEEKSNFSLNYFKQTQLNHIKFFDKIRINDNPKSLYYIMNHKYSFSTFDQKINNDYDDSDYISYYHSYINNISIKSDKKGKLSNKEELCKFITCRYMDNSFKIHRISKNKIENMSIFCEDFVTSCCTLDHNKFLIGLKNGKLIQWSIENEISEKSIDFRRQIQAHSKSITLIEKNNRLGIIITAGEDNYVFIRKIYDLELITPIKLKQKYIITMAKVSPMNFLYLICFNKKRNKNKAIILGYTLSGLFFAKSKYGFYDSLDFTKSGNIVTWANKKEIKILSGDNLTNINIDINDKEMLKLQQDLVDSIWIKFNFFSRKNGIEQSICKVITCTKIDKNNKENTIKMIDVSNNKYFD